MKRFLPIAFVVFAAIMVLGFATPAEAIPIGNHVVLHTFSPQSMNSSGTGVGGAQQDVDVFNAGAPIFADVDLAFADALGIANYGALGVAMSAGSPTRIPVLPGFSAEASAFAEWNDILVIHGPAGGSGMAHFGFHLTGSVTGWSSASYGIVYDFGGGNFGGSSGSYVGSQLLGDPNDPATQHYETQFIDQLIDFVVPFTYETPFILHADLGVGGGGIGSVSGRYGSAQFGDTLLITSFVLPGEATGHSAQSGTDYSHIQEPTHSVPEPSSALLAMVGLTMMAALEGRRRTARLATRR